jgi:eukaryotic-like serine/threonine-protein kinase
MSSAEPGNRPAMVSTDMLFAPGVTLGSRYALTRKIGAGGYSEVWEAHDAVLDRPVAIKVLHAEYAESADALHRFRAEAQLAGRLSDANVARVYDFCDTSGHGQPYLVMELVDGPTLAELLRGGPLEPTEAMDVLAQSAAGLHAAHCAGLVHRDIKPSNIMIAPGNVVKITDFGLSHSLASAPITRAGMIAGTPSFMAPERSAGARATPASDLYALGVVGYECLAGGPPFSGTPLEVALAHRYGVFPPLPAATPAPVAELIARLTARDPADRPDDAEMVARQAAHLRDALPAAPPGYGPALPPLPESPGRSDTGQAQHTLIVAAMPSELEPGLLPPRRRTGATIGWLAAAAAGVAAVIAIVAVALAQGGGAPPTAPQRPAGSGAAAIRAVEVSRGALIGQPVQQAAQQLRNEGFRVRVLWQPDAQQPAGAVLRADPAGLRPEGSLITLVAAFRPGHGHHHDHQHGGGNGQGNGND